MGKIKCFVTNQGRELLSKCQSDSKSITFTRLTAGSGVYSEDEDLKEKTSLKEHKQTFSSFYISRENGNVTIIRGILSNEGLEESYKVREIGIWAKEKDSENEILYAISVTLDDEMADLMFVKQSEQYSSIEYNHYLKIDNDIQVTIVPDADNSLARMYMEFDNLKKEYYKLIKKGSLILEDDVEKMRYNDCGFQVKEKDGEWKSARVGSGYPPKNMYLFKAYGGYDKVLLKFILPPDTPSDKVAGVMFRYGTDKIPQNINDGTLAYVYKLPDYKQNNEEEIEVYAENLTPDTEYYFKAFPFTFAGAFNENNLGNYSKTRTLSNPDKEYLYMEQTGPIDWQIEIAINIEGTIFKKTGKYFSLEIEAGKKYSVKSNTHFSSTLLYPDKIDDIIAKANNIRIIKFRNLYMETRQLESMTWEDIYQVAKAKKAKTMLKIGDIKYEGGDNNRVWQLIKIEDKNAGERLYFRLLKGYKVFERLSLRRSYHEFDEYDAPIYDHAFFDTYEHMDEYGFTKDFTTHTSFRFSHINTNSWSIIENSTLGAKSYLGDLEDNQHNRILFDENGRKLNVFKLIYVNLNDNSGDSKSEISAIYYDVETNTDKSIKYSQRFDEDISAYANQPIYMSTIIPLFVTVN